jgi:hypothetical protein
MRRLACVLAVTLVPAVTHADVSHEVELGYEISVTASGDTAGDGLLVTSLGAVADYVLQLGEDWTVSVEAAAIARRIEGAVRASTLSTRGALSWGPTPFPASNRDDGRISFFPFTAELEHEGDLAALPRMSDRADVARAPYLWQRVEGATRAVRIEMSDDGVDEAADRREDRFAGAVDVIPVRSSVDITEQGGRRLDIQASGALLGVVSRFPGDGFADVLAIEQRLTRLPGGEQASIDVVWPARGEVVLPKSGLVMRAAWGVVFDSRSSAPRPRVVEHRPRDIGSFGLAFEHGRWAGGVQWDRAPYVAMNAEPVLEDRIALEGLWTGDQTRLRGKAFLARTQRLDDAEAEGVWTGGVELDARRDVGAVDLGVSAEVGQSYYAVLDGAAPSADFGARGALTIRRARGKRWFY